MAKLLEGEIFEINEKLKEDLINFFGAYKAKTVYRKKGNFLVKDPYLETETYWSLKDFKGINNDIFDEMTDLLFDTKKQISKLGALMTEPTFELFTGQPLLVWAIFETKQGPDIQIF
jgi:hypothetical protein